MKTTSNQFATILSTAIHNAVTTVSSWFGSLFGGGKKK